MNKKQTKFTAKDIVNVINNRAPERPRARPPASPAAPRKLPAR